MKGQTLISESTSLARLSTMRASLCLVAVNFSVRLQERRGTMSKRVEELTLEMKVIANVAGHA